MGSIKARHFDQVGAALFGVVRQSVLRLLFGHPDRHFYQSQIIATLGLGSGAVQRELGRLAGAGVLTRSVEGRQTYFQVNRQCPVFQELHGLIRKTFGVAEVMQRGLATLATQIQLAFVYGSAVRGIQGAASDLDVMVVGERVSVDEVVAALSDSERVLGREVNPSVYRTEEFCRKLAQGHHFLSSVVSGPKIFLIGDEHELEGLAQIRVVEGTQNEPRGNRRSVRGRR
jgi:predicted nucleotidyltransferase